MIPCPACGTLHVPGSTQCMKCGAAIPQAPAPSFGGSPGATAGPGPTSGSAPGGYGAPAGAAPPSAGAPTGGAGWGAPPPGPQGFGAAPTGGGYPGGGGLPQPPFAGAPMPPGDGRRIELGDVFQTAYELWRRNAVSLLVLLGGFALPGTLITLVGSIVQMNAMRESMASGTAPANPYAALGSALEGVWIIYLGLFVSMVLGAIAQGASSKIGLETMAGRSAPTVGEAIGAASGRLLSLLGATIVLGIGVVFGCLCFCVPGVLVILGTCITYPVILAEGKGAIEALQRSWELTDGAKFDIFLVMLVGAAVALGLYVPIACIAFATGGMDPMSLGPLQIVLRSIAGLAYQAALGSFYTMIAVVLYARRVGLGTGTDAGAVAQVFR